MPGECCFKDGFIIIRVSNLFLRYHQLCLFIFCRNKLDDKFISYCSKEFRNFTKRYILANGQMMDQCQCKYKVCFCTLYKGCSFFIVYTNSRARVGKVKD